MDVTVMRDRASKSHVMTAPKLDVLPAPFFTSSITVANDALEHALEHVGQDSGKGNGMV